jgi:hypothetical protein
MSEAPHSEAPSPTPIRAAGARRINLDMRVRLDQADRFQGLPRGSAKPFELLGLDPTAVSPAAKSLTGPELTKRPDLTHKRTQPERAQPGIQRKQWVVDFRRSAER